MVRPVHQVPRLDDLELVARTPDATDRRTTVLAPTPSGIALAAQAVQAARGVTEATLAPLPPGERQHFLDLLGLVA